MGRYLRRGPTVNTFKKIFYPSVQADARACQVRFFLWTIDRIFFRFGHLTGRGGCDVHGDGHVRAGTVCQCHRDVSNRIRPGSRHGGGQCHIQHAGRVGVRWAGRPEGHQTRKVAVTPGQRRVHRDHRRAGRHRRGRRGHVVRGDVHVVYVLRLFPVDVHTGQA